LKKNIDLRPRIILKKLIIEPNELFVPIENDYPALEAEYLRLKPTKTPINKVRTKALASVRAQRLRG